MVWNKYISSCLIPSCVQYTLACVLTGASSGWWIARQRISTTKHQNSFVKIKNWFSCIRQKGLNNDSRTSWEYESAGRAIAVNWMLTSVSQHSNCEIDFDYYIGVMSNIQSVTKTENSGVKLMSNLPAASSTACPDLDSESTLSCSCKFMPVSLLCFIFYVSFLLTNQFWHTSPIFHCLCAVAIASQ